MLVLIGGTGTGKTHLAMALGVKAITQHGRRVRFFSAVELTNSLELEKAAGKQGKLAYSLMPTDIAILDGRGYLPFSQARGALLFHPLTKLYENTNGLIRQYLPKGMCLKSLTQAQCNDIANQINDRPRQRLGCRTPAEVFFGRS